MPRLHWVKEERLRQKICTFPQYERTAEIWKVQNGTPARLKQFSNSYFVSIARVDKEIWAVRAKYKHGRKQFSLHYSNNDALSWMALQDIPVDDVEQIYLHNSCGWIQGLHTLIRSCNNGKTWKHLPLDPKSISQSTTLSFTEKRVLLGGENIRYSEDYGLTWTTIEEKADVLYERWVASVENNQLKIGTIGKDSVDWRYTTDHKYQPTNLFVQKDKIYLLANNQAKERQPAIALFSKDGGKTFQEKILHGCYDAEKAKITSKGVAFMSRRGKMISRQL